MLIAKHANELSRKDSKRYILDDALEILDFV